MFSLSSRRREKGAEKTRSRRTEVGHQSRQADRLPLVSLALSCAGPFEAVDDTGRSFFMYILSAYVAIAQQDRMALFVGRMKSIESYRTAPMGPPESGFLMMPFSS